MTNSTTTRDNLRDTRKALADYDARIATAEMMLDWLRGDVERVTEVEE